MIKLWWCWILWKLKLAKNCKLREEANRDMVYGALLGLVKDPKFWRRSSVHVKYSILTDEGREVLHDVMEQLLRTIDQCDNDATDERAKELMWTALKGENNESK
jgi:hypothetical protein